jgi:hypothetical protein
MINENLQCDFCSVPDPAWRYPARSFVAYCAPNVAGESVGDWAACDLCHLFCMWTWRSCTNNSLHTGAERRCPSPRPLGKGDEHGRRKCHQ